MREVNLYGRKESLKNGDIFQNSFFFPFSSMSHSSDHDAEVPYLSLNDAMELTQGGNMLRVQVRLNGPEEHEAPLSIPEVIQAYRNAHRESVFQVIRPAKCLGEFSPQDIELDERHQGVVDQCVGWTDALWKKIDRVLEVACTPLPEPRVISGNEDERKKKWTLHMQMRMEVQRRAAMLEEVIMKNGPAALADTIRLHMFAVWAGEEDVLEKIWGQTLGTYYDWFGAVRSWEQVLGMEESDEVLPRDFVEEQLTRIFGEPVDLSREQNGEGEE